jgi:WD40 repeat protein
MIGLYGMFKKTLLLLWLFATIISPIKASDHKKAATAFENVLPAQLWALVVGYTSLEDSQTIRADGAQISEIVFSPNGQYMIMSTQINSEWIMKVYRLQHDGQWQFLQDLKGHMSAINSIAYSGDGTYLISGSADQIKIWQWQDNKLICSHTLLCANSVASVAISPDNKYLALGLSNGCIEIKKFENNQLSNIEFDKTRIANFWPVKLIKFSSDGTYMAACAENHQTINIWKLDANQWKFIQLLESHNNEIQTFTIFPDDQSLMSISEDKTITWRVENDAWISESIETGGASCHSIKCSIDGKCMVYVGYSSILHQRNIDNRWEAIIIPSQSLIKRPAVSISPNGNYIAIGEANAIKILKNQKLELQELI